MDKDKVTVAVALVFLLAFMVFAAYLFSINTALEEKLDALNVSTSQKLIQMQKDYNEMNSRYLVAQKQLRDANAALDEANAGLALTLAQLAEANLQLEESKQSLASQQQYVSEITSNLSKLESSINDSMSWFRGNAYMPSGYSWAGDIFMSRISSDCVDKGSLNFACISHLMENTAFAIHYREDIAAGSEDHLQSLKETIDLGWGDCEDYSLLFKAVLNSMREEDSGLIATAWQPAESGEFRVYPKEASDSGNEPYWVYSKAKAAPMGSLSNSYVICYSVTPAAGHCTVALTGVKVNESSQVPFLQGAEVFEPQSGRYLGRIGESLSICTHQGCKNMGGKIWLVISDSDLYIYNDNGWGGYADTLAQVQQEKASLPS